MSKEEIKSNIIEIKMSDKEERHMMCPFRTHQINYQVVATGAPTEVHQVSEFTDCYLDSCFFYENKQCLKVNCDLGRDVSTRR